MAITIPERIEKLQSALEPLTPEDTMAEAGRKVLLADYIKVLSHQEGTRTGEDVEDVHQMRVSLRRIRSLLRLLRPYFKKRVIHHYSRELQRVASALGEIRDLDVLLGNLREFQARMPVRKRSSLKPILEEIEGQLQQERDELNVLLDTRDYRGLVKEFSSFLTTPGAEARSTSGSAVQPHQIRHILPEMIYRQLAAVRAYEGVVEIADAATLHGLRIEFKRLRYTVSVFDAILGKSIGNFIDELKRIQDCLGEMNDCAFARRHLSDLAAAKENDALQPYLAHLQEREATLRQNFMEVWTRFNTRRVQEHLALAVLALR